MMFDRWIRSAWTRGCWRRGRARHVARAVFAGAALVAALGCRSEMSREDHRQTLLETREAVADAVAAGDVERIFSFWTDDMVIYPVGEAPVKGKAAVREYVRRNRQDLGVVPRTQLLEVDASASGDLGYIVGTYEWVNREGEGTRPGRYVTLWRKNEDGDWKCFLEIHSPDPDGETNRESTQ